MRGLAFRICLFCINVFFPPVSTMILCGPNIDFIWSCIFFILGVIPSHIHGFYISQTYFHRRRKVRKGRWPGGPKALIYSDYVINGGASPSQAKKLYNEQFVVQQQQQRRRSGSGSLGGGGRQASLSRPASQRVAMAQVPSNLQRTPSRTSQVQRNSYVSRGRI